MLLLSHLVAAQDGQIDASFGQDGWAYYQAGDFASVQQVAAQPDGHILILTEGRLLRLTPEGIFDNAFGTFGSFEGVATFDLMPDGRIVVAGFTEEGNLGPLALKRLSPTGQVEPGFGTTDPFSQVAVISGQVIRIKPNGKILITLFDNNFALAIAQFLPNGEPDPTFGNGGLQVPLPAVEVTTYPAADIAVMPDNRAVVLTQGPNESRVLLRLLDDGSLDPSFGNQGMVGVSPQFDDVYALAVQSDGKPLVGGDRQVNGRGDFFLVRHLENGSLDPSFGSGGGATTDFDDKSDVIYDLALQPDGKILAVGQANGDNPFFEAGIARYLHNGQLDQTFALGGKDAQYLSTGNGTYGAVCLQPDGGIIAAGTYSDLFSFENSVVFATRYRNQLGTDIDEANDIRWQLLAQPGEHAFTLRGSRTAAARWRLIDAQGRIHRQATVTSAHTPLPVSGLPAGVYWLQVMTAADLWSTALRVE